MKEFDGFRFFFFPKIFVFPQSSERLINTELFVLSTVAYWIYNFFVLKKWLFCIFKYIFCILKYIFCIFQIRSEAGTYVLEDDDRSEAEARSEIEKVIFAENLQKLFLYFKK